jgi:hypothetical protein
MGAIRETDNTGDENENNTKNRQNGPWVTRVVARGKKKEKKNFKNVIVY